MAYITKSCARCGTGFRTLPYYGTTMCARCRERTDRERLKQERLSRCISPAPPEAKPKPVKRPVTTKTTKTIQEIAAEARAAGMTYGRYVAREGL